MAGKRANLTVLLKLDNKRFVSGLRTARAAAGRFALGVGQLGLKVARAALMAFTAAVAASTAAMIIGVKSAFDFGGRLSDLSARSGEAVGELMIMEQAFINAGVPAEELGITLDRLTRRTAIALQGNNAYSKSLVSAGIDALELSRMSKIDRLIAFGTAVNNMGDETARTLAVMDMLDTGGGRLNDLFSDMAGNVGRAKEQIGGQADIFERQAQEFDRISDSMGQISLKMRGFFAGVASNIAPMLLEVADRFDKIDLAPMGKKFGEAIANAMDNVKALPALIGDGLILAGMEFVNILRKGVGQVIAQLAIGKLKFLAGPAAIAAKAAGTSGPMSNALEVTSSSDAAEVAARLVKEGDLLGMENAIKLNRIKLRLSIEDLFKDKTPDDEGFSALKEWIEGMPAPEPIKRKEPVFFDFDPKTARAFLGPSLVKPEEDEKPFTNSERINLQRSFLPAGGSVRRGVAGRGARQGGLDALAALNRQSPGVKEQERSNVKLDTLIGRLDDFNRLAREAL
tara:strand:+ start:766 stop:2304 length:1539 start_codon:yes stop_codon:yes gene_type:complete